jgi:hypothetical protein
MGDEPDPRDERIAALDAERDRALKQRDEALVLAVGFRTERDRYRTVVDAAKAWRAERSGVPGHPKPYLTWEGERALAAAVDALDEDDPRQPANQREEP